jgi:crotonobetainyl-CoA:carnitine CoA-transferase CaiB-like acyl-CoA transferase
VIRALAGVRVVDLTQYLSGPYCTMVLADLGAEVTKIERPGGEVYRRQGPVFAPGGESASFLTLNRGKSSLELDLREPADRERLHRLLDEADVLVENATPGAMDRLGLDFGTVHARHPRLVYVSISGFGQEGPDAQRGGYDLVVQALSGLLSMTGPEGGDPAKVPIAALDFGSGLYAALGALAALRERETTGEGRHVTTSILECALAWLSMHIVTQQLGGEEPAAAGTRSPFFAPYEAFRAGDGHLVIVGTGGGDAWERLCGALGLEHLRADPRFADNARRVANAAALRDIIEDVLADRDVPAWTAVLEEAGVVCAPVQRLSQVLESAQVRALGLIDRQEHPSAGPIPRVGTPLSFDGERAVSPIPPPILGGGIGERSQ